ncbi:hypothetical protein MTP99_004137 [Tenebrio molitor]|nr:hypothetical protein MTP99_004137 [Tenebrio molitor]
MVDDIMKVIELWPLDTSDDKTKNHILKWSRWINRFAVVNSSLILLCTVIGFFSRDEDNGWTFIRYIFEELFDQWGQFIFVFGKLTLLSIALLIPAHAYQEIYITQHITFQIMLCTMFTRRMSSVLRITEENLIYDENYQEEIETKLKIIIDRHNDFLRWERNALMNVNYLIIPFVMGAIVLPLSFVFSLLQEMVWWPNYILFIVLLVNICSFIVAAQLLEDESEKMVLELSASKWYTWNNKNKKNLLTILSRTGRPLKIKFSENFVVNNRILLFICKTVYSIVSVVLNVQ